MIVSRLATTTTYALLATLLALLAFSRDKRFALKDDVQRFLVDILCIRRVQAEFSGTDLDDVRVILVLLQQLHIYHHDTHEKVVNWEKYRTGEPVDEQK